MDKALINSIETILESQIADHEAKEKEYFAKLDDVDETDEFEYIKMLASKIKRERKTARFYKVTLESFRVQSQK